MTKEEIKTLIDTKIAGQGTNVDGGGALATILNGIVNAMPEGGGAEPLIVEGTSDGGHFIPNSGQPTKADAIEAVKSGRMVIVKVPSPDNETVFLWQYIRTLNEADNTLSFPVEVWD